MSRPQLAMLTVSKASKNSVSSSSNAFGGPVNTSKTEIVSSQWVIETYSYNKLQTNKHIHTKTSDERFRSIVKSLSSTQKLVHSQHRRTENEVCWGQTVLKALIELCIFLVSIFLQNLQHKMNMYFMHPFS